MRIFLDNNFSPKDANALRPLVEQLGHEVHHLTELFSADEDDAVWLEKLGEDGDWCVITLDGNIRRKARERAAWSGRRLWVFFLTKGWSDLPLLKRHGQLAINLGAILAKCVGETHGGFTVHADGTMKVVHTAMVSKPTGPTLEAPDAR